MWTNAIVREMFKSVLSRNFEAGFHIGLVKATTARIASDGLGRDESDAP
jgi:hypothetical protein